MRQHGVKKTKERTTPLFNNVNHIPHQTCDNEHPQPGQHLHRERQEHQLDQRQAQTFAFLVPIVQPPSWAIVAFHAARRVYTLALAVAPAVACLALVHIYTHARACMRLPLTTFTINDTD